mgnify:FL=1
MSDKKNQNDSNESPDSVILESFCDLPLCECITKNPFNKNEILQLNSDCGKIIISKNSHFHNTNKFERGKIYLIGRQGKSKHIGIWQFDELSKSNDNLIYFSNKRNNNDFVIPEGGPAQGLKGKAIILEI